MAARPTIVGLNACLAALSARPEAIRRAWVTEDAKPRASPLLRDLARRRRPYRVVSAGEIQKVSGAAHHEGVCVEAPPPAQPSESELIRALARAAGPVRALYLDGVQNPHNVGAIVRTAAHFGARAAIGDEAELPRLGPAVMRVAEGGAEHVAIAATPSPAALFAELSRAGFSIVATSARASAPLYESALPDRVVFLLGAERGGLSEEARAHADTAVAIPGTGSVQSLNVSAAAAVLLAEHARQRGL